jgi:hypothetical protein
MSAAAPKPPEGPFAEPPQDAAAFQAATGANNAQMADVEAFQRLLSEWNEKMNLVGPSALAAVQSITMNDASKLKDGQAQYSALLTPPKIIQLP